MFDSGNIASCVCINKLESAEEVQIGLGSEDVIFFAPHPTNVNALATKKARLASAFWGLSILRKSWFLENIIDVDKSVSST